MSENKNKPNVFDVDSNIEQPLTPNYDKVQEIQLYPANENELKYATQMKEEAELQMRIKAEGEALGLYGKELKQYVAEKSGDISKRPHLSIEKPKATITYKSEEKDEMEISESDLAKEKARLFESIENDPELKEKEIRYNKWVDSISEPQYDAPFELVKLPSLGKQYKTREGAHIKMAFLNGSDENILINPNVMKSGRFLEILFSRKILSNIKYKDLIPADRDALMIWLRGTAYGDEYPIVVTDPRDLDKEEPRTYDVNIELSKLPVKELQLTPNKNGNFEFTTKMGNIIEFKYLTIGQLEKLQIMVLAKFDEFGEFYTDTMADFLSELIVSYNGNTDKEYIRKQVNYMPMSELNEFKKFMADNDFGVDFNLTIETEGGVVNTAFPINAEFFWATT